MRSLVDVQSSAGFGVLLLAAIALIGCDSKKEVSAHPLVLQGQTDADDPAVVALRMGDDDYCSAAVVAPTWVLTAAHCFDRGGAVSVSYRSSNIYGRAGDWKLVKAVHVEEGWIPGRYFSPNFEHDIALVELADPAPSNITPIPINLDHDAARRIDHVRMVGYGPTRTNRGDQGTKRTADVPVVPEHHFFDTRAGSGSCYGDSGGPSFAMIDGKERVVAVTSHHMSDTCEGAGGRIVRTDQHQAFLARYLEPRPEPPPELAPIVENTNANTAPIECRGSQAIVLHDMTITATSGPAVRAVGSCSITLVNVNLQGPVGIEASGSSSVTMTGGSIDASSKPFTTHGSASVNIVGTRVTKAS